MSIGTVTKLTRAEDLEGLDANLAIMARAALGAGYKVENRCLRFQDMLFVDDKHFHPLTNWQQCVRLLVDTKGYFELSAGMVFVSAQEAHWSEKREPTTDTEYRNQMCEAVVTNIAKACPF